MGPGSWMTGWGLCTCINVGLCTAAPKRPKFQNFIDIKAYVPYMFFIESHTPFSDPVNRPLPLRNGAFCPGVQLPPWLCAGAEAKSLCLFRILLALRVA